MVVGLTSAHVIRTLLDPNKGSMTNRIDCAKEHAKNDVVNGSKILLAGGAVAGTAALVHAGKSGTSTAVAGKAATYVTKAMTYVGNGMAKIATKLKATGLAEKLAKHPTKAGLAALAVAGGVYILDRAIDFFTTKGRIDQKYEDAAAIESSTKNVVLA